MALERCIKTEHSGAKNGDKIGKRVDVKKSSRKRRRHNGKRMTSTSLRADG
jgi:hypothetical protein